MLVFVASTTIATSAGANGRNPHTVGIYFTPGDDQSLYVATTFGLVKSTDGGCTFDWMCEQSIGYGGTWDPQYEIGSDGTIFATTFEGLRISRDGGCTFETAAGTNGLWIDALTIGPTGQIWIGTAETAGINDVFVSTNNGMTFEPRGMQSPEIWWKSVKVAPSNPARVYITGYKVADTPAAYFYRSTNGGADWTPSPLANITYGGTPVLRVKAVDPINPDIVFMTSELSNAAAAGDRLYRSTDGGVTWTEVLQTTATVHDVVIRDAAHVIVATQVKTATSLVGGTTYTSTDGGLTFAEMTGVPELACLTQSSSGALFGCGANWDPDFKAIARSTDGGASWEKVWRFSEMNDAVQCSDGTVQHDTCDVMLWDCPTCGTDLKRQFTAKGPSCGAGASDAVPPKKPGGCCGAGDPLGAVWALIVLGPLVRRRRARRAGCAS
jgi:hypothetical protein